MISCRGLLVLIEPVILFCMGCHIHGGGETTGRPSVNSCPQSYTKRRCQALPKRLLTVPSYFVLACITVPLFCHIMYRAASCLSGWPCGDEGAGPIDRLLDLLAAPPSCYPDTLLSCSLPLSLFLFPLILWATLCSSRPNPLTSFVNRSNSGRAQAK